MGYGLPSPELQEQAARAFESANVDSSADGGRQIGQLIVERDFLAKRSGR
jgi:hypothetical protein